MQSVATTCGDKMG